MRFWRIKRSRKNDRDEFFRYFEKFAQITAVQARQHNNSTAIANIDYLKASVLRFSKRLNEYFYLAERDIETGKRSDLRAIREIFGEEKKLPQDVQEAKDALYDFVRYNPPFGGETFSVAFKNIWSQAYQAKNDTITTHCVHNIVWIISELVHDTINAPLVQQFLNTLYSVAREIIVDRRPISDRSIYAALYHWYIVVAYNSHSQEKPIFDLVYFNQFDKAFLRSIEFLISEEDTYLFENLIEFLHDGVNIYPSLLSGNIREYQELMKGDDLTGYYHLLKENKYEERLDNLRNKSTSLVTKEGLDKWIDEFNIIATSMRKHIKDENLAKADSTAKDILFEAEDNYKWNHLREVIFTIGSFCIYAKRYEYIKILLEYHHPPDADATYTGKDPIPRTTDGVLNFYLLSPVWVLSRKYEFGEGHRGCEIYYQTYFILLLLNSIGKKRLIGEPPVDLSKHDSGKLNELKHFLDTINAVLPKITANEKLLQIINIDKDSGELKAKELADFLGDFKAKIDNQMTRLEQQGEISKKKIDEFIDSFKAAFERDSYVRMILKRYDLILDRTEEEAMEEIRRVGINLVDPKAAFFEEWYAASYKWGETKGRAIAKGENDLIIQPILDNCQTIDAGDFENKLGSINLEDEPIILLLNARTYRLFTETDKFKPIWKHGSDESEIPGMEGKYQIKGKNIRVYRIARTPSRIGGRELMLILNMRKIGKLLQYSPLMADESPEIMHGIFYIGIDAFSENKELLDKFIGNPPVWLSEKGDDENMRQYLLSKVLINIYERFEFKIAEEFEGYVIQLPEGITLPQ
jgi:hypothetical protein